MERHIGSEKGDKRGGDGVAAIIGAIGRRGYRVHMGYFQHSYQQEDFLCQIVTNFFINRSRREDRVPV